MKKKPPGHFWTYLENHLKQPLGIYGSIWAIFLLKKIKVVIGTAQLKPTSCMYVCTKGEGPWLPSWHFVSSHPQSLQMSLQPIAQYYAKIITLHWKIPRVQHLLCLPEMNKTANGLYSQKYAVELHSSHSPNQHSHMPKGKLHASYQKHTIIINIWLT